jgi:parallel beta-helix repeat protein
MANDFTIETSPRSIPLLRMIPPRPVLAILLACFLPAAALSKTIHVPGHYAKIQQAIQAAGTGDTIIVAPGTYDENIDFLGKAVTLTSNGGPEATIIDGRATGTVVTFDDGEGKDSVLQGFTVTNGSGTATLYLDRRGGGIYCRNLSSPTINGNNICGNHADIGGGIYCEDASPEIRANTIESNTAGGCGGIYLEDCAPLITKNTVSNNTSVNYGGGIQCVDGSPEISDNLIIGNAGTSGGGIYISLYSSPLISGNTITGNSALEGQGGGIFATSNAYPTITHNTITENVSNSGGGISCFHKSSAIIINNLIANNTAVSFSGGGISCWQTECDPLITNNLLIDNNAFDKGGGIYCYQSSPLIANSTLIKNQALYGGGIACHTDASPEIVNTILWSNTANYGKEISATKVLTGFACHPVISYSDVEGGQSSTYIVSTCSLDWGQGMINADPLFINAPAGDFHLRYASPCRDAGTNAGKNLPNDDFEGDPRVAIGDMDIGADEFHPHLYCTGEAAPGNLITIHLVDLPGTSPVVLWIGTGILDPPMTTGYGDWYLAFPLLLQANLSSIPSGGVLSLPHTLPPDTPTPWDIPLQGGAGTNLTNLCIIEIR